MKRVVVQSGITAGQMKDFWAMVIANVITGKTMSYFMEHTGEINEAAGVGTWWGEIVEKEQFPLQAFFGRGFDLSFFAATLEEFGLEKIRYWAGLGLRPCYLPKIAMPEEANFPGWKIKPEQWYWEQAKNGKILRFLDKQLVKAIPGLDGIVALVDTRLKPRYDNGKQMYANDNLLGPIIKKLREQEKIAKYIDGPQDSRFGISFDEWEQHIKPALAESLGFGPQQIRLETTIERNAISQIYSDTPRKDDGSTNTSVWCEEFLGTSRHLRGGDSDCGGLAHADCDSACSNRWSDRGVRPLVVLEVEG